MDMQLPYWHARRGRSGVAICGRIRLSRVAHLTLPLLAQSRHAQGADACPLLPAERTSLIPLAEGISFMIKTDRNVTECGAQTKTLSGQANAIFAADP